jgi:hypothetical protein
VEPARAIGVGPGRREFEFPTPRADNMARAAEDALAKEAMEGGG